jgi:hypothetical protein
VVRALESAEGTDGNVRAGQGVAVGRIGRETRLRVVDAILTGVHQAGESHFELLKAFADDAALSDISEHALVRGYRTHEFGDSMLIERQAGAEMPCAITQHDRHHHGNHHGDQPENGGPPDPLACGLAWRTRLG